MRGWRLLLPLAVVCASLSLWAAAASANSIAFTATLGSAWSQDDSGRTNPNGDCGGTLGGFPQPAFGAGYPYGRFGDPYTQWAFGGWDQPVVLPSGAVLTGAVLSGGVSQSTLSGYTAPAGTYGVEVGAGAGAVLLTGRNRNCIFPTAYGQGDSFAVALSGSTAPVPFSADAYDLARTYLLDGSGDVYLATADGGLPLGLWLAPRSPLTLTLDYLYTPSGLSAQQMDSGSGTQAQLSWNPAGNAGGTQYLVQRETLGANGVMQGWSTIEQGGATEFTTTDQGCGRGYLYRVAAVGARASTAWDNSAEWDAPPCAVSATGASAASVTLSWPEVTVAAVPEVVWCEEGTPAGGVSCSQRAVTLAAGTTAVTLTGLVPNAEYAVWACSTTAPWGCPQANVWTYAAVPTLSAVLNTTGVSADDQPLVWTSGGNAPGTVFWVRQDFYAPDGAWQGAGLVYQGTATGFSVRQTAGGSYRYTAGADNAGYGNATPPSPGLWVQVASTPDVTTLGPTSARVSWPPVAGMVTTGVACAEQNSGDWFYPGPATGGATSLLLTGLLPNTAYWCATFAVASNQGIAWWQLSTPVYTSAVAPLPGAATVTQTTLTANWASGGNPPGTQYQVVLDDAGVSWVQAATTSATSYTFRGILPGLPATVRVQALGRAATPTAQGATPLPPDSPFVAEPTVTAVPLAPGISGADGGLGWSPAAGRGYVTLSWSPSPGATGYTLYAWDGAGFEAFPLGDVTTWDSRQGRLYPGDGTLYPNVGPRTPPLFVSGGAGRNLRDLPQDLYCTSDPAGCAGAPANYRFTVAASNAGGSSAAYQVPGSSDLSYYAPTLPLQTDPGAPTITAWSVNDGGGYTAAGAVSFQLNAVESPSGVAAYALSNDGSTWRTTDVPGCVVGQSPACSTTLAAAGDWQLLPGPGPKEVWARVESAAGVWSPPEETTVYVTADQTVPTVDVQLDGGAVTSASTSVAVNVSVTDPAATGGGLSWRARYSVDGGATWSAWVAEGQAMTWSTTRSLPAGSSGPRTLLVQVENSDDNLGQGGATIQYVAPAANSAGSSAGAGAGHACTWPLAGKPVSATCVTTSLVSVPLLPPAAAVQMRLSLDDATWGPWAAPAAQVTIDLGASPGAKSVWVEYRDAQGAVSVNPPLIYVYDPAGPSVQAAWAGGASATDPGGHATLQLQAADDVGPSGMDVTVAENGAMLFSGAFQDALALQLTGAGYQLLQVTVTDAAGNATTTVVGIYVQ